MKNLIATNIDLFSDKKGYTGFGPLGLENGGDSVGTFQTFISSSIGLITIIALIWFVYIIVTSGISYMSAGADQKATEAAKKKISNGVIGLLITIFGIFLINLVGQIFSIKGLLDLPSLFERITK